MRNNYVSNITNLETSSLIAFYYSHYITKTLHVSEVFIDDSSNNRRENSNNEFI